MTECPYCRRRLLSQASPTCNWCGREIEDAAYQQRATVAREAFFVEQALHDAASLAAIEGLPVGNPWLSPLDPLTGMPMMRLPRPVPTFPPLAAPPPIVSPEPAAEEEAVPETELDSEPGARFRHLEL